ncbi:MAG: YaiI/YqxD family protein [Gemmataceae bacterium]
MIYVDADACPVKAEVLKVATRYDVPVRFVANTPLQLPTRPSIEMVVRSGFGGVDDWITEQAAAGDIVITADIPLAARCLEKNARVLSPKGRAFTDNDIGDALAARGLMDELRQSGVVSGGPAPMTQQDRSRFLSRLDETIHAVRRAYPPA